MAISLEDYKIVDIIRQSPEMRLAVQAAIMSEKSVVFARSSFATSAEEIRHKALCRNIQLYPEKWVGLFCFSLAYNQEFLQKVGYDVVDGEAIITISFYDVLEFVIKLWDEMSYL